MVNSDRVAAQQIPPRSWLYDVLSWFIGGLLLAASAFLLLNFTGVLVWSSAAVMLSLGLPALALPPIIRRRYRRTWLEPMSELATFTGLRLVFPRGNIHFGNPLPDLEGESRGRHVTLMTAFMSIANQWGPSNRVPYLQWRVAVKNKGRSTLRISRRGLQWALRRSGSMISGGETFDRLFQAEGAPPDFAAKSVGLIARSDPSLWDGLGFSSASGEAIRLEGGELTLSHGAGIRDAQRETVVLRLLCDLAEIAEQQPGPN